MAKTVKIKDFKPDPNTLYQIVRDHGGYMRLVPIKGKWETRRVNLPEFKGWKMSDEVPYPPITCQTVFVPER